MLHKENIKKPQLKSHRSASTEVEAADNSVEKQKSVESGSRSSFVLLFPKSVCLKWYTGASDAAPRSQFPHPMCLRAAKWERSLQLWVMHEIHPSRQLPLSNHSLLEDPNNFGRTWIIDKPCAHPQGRSEISLVGLPWLEMQRERAPSPCCKPIICLNQNSLTFPGLHKGISQWEPPSRQILAL